MSNHEAILNSKPPVERYNLPGDADWQSVDEVPTDFRQIVELQMMAQREGAYIDDVARVPVSLEEVFEAYDSWTGGQQVLVIRDETGSIIGMLSYYFESNGTPFLESVGVDPDYQGDGIGATLIDTALEELRDSTEAPYAVARAQTRVVDIYARRWGAEVLDEDGSDTVRIAVPIPR